MPGKFHRNSKYSRKTTVDSSAVSQTYKECQSNMILFFTKKHQFPYGI